MVTVEQIIEGEAKLLRLVRANPGVSRVELARIAGISPSTVGGYINRLLAKGYIREGKKHILGQRGRPATRLELKPEAGFMLGLDVSFHFVRVVALDFNEHVFARESRWLDLGTEFDEFLDRALALAASCMENGVGEFLGIGISHSPPSAAPGTPHIHAWDDDSVSDRFEATLGRKPHIALSNHAVGAAELWFGAGRNVSSFLSLEVRSTVGVELVWNGGMVGDDGKATGQVGHWQVPREMLPDLLCGEISGCLTLNQLASVPGLLTLCASVLPTVPDTSLRMQGDELLFGELRKGLRDGDPLALAAIEAAGAAMGWCAARVTDLMAPERVIVSYPFSELGAPLLRHIRNGIKKSAGAPLRRTPTVAASRLKEYAGAIGAAAVALHHWRPVHR